jgi:hypothetical protein
MADKKDPLDKLRNDVILPAKGSAGEKRLKVEIEILKYLGVAAHPVAGTIAKASLDVFKVFKDFRKEEKDANAAAFLEALARIVANHEKRLDRLEPPTPAAVEKEPFAAVFVHNLEAAYNDDEREKARFYAAFAAGIHEQGKDLPRATKVILFDVLKQLRAHDLLVMKVIINRVDRVVGRAAWNPSNPPRMQSRELIEEVQRGETGVELGLIDHSLNSLDGAGLIRVVSGAVRVVNPGYPAEGVALSVVEVGKHLMDLILPYLPKE